MELCGALPSELIAAPVVKRKTCGLNELQKSFVQFQGQDGLLLGVSKCSWTNP